MNKQARQSKKRRTRRFARGQSMIEMAAVLPVLAVLLLAATDFARLYYTNIEVENAARAGAQYGSQSLITAADASGMKAAAQNDAFNLTGMSASAKQCTCMTSTTVAACPTAYCTSNPNATFVEVDTSKVFNTIIMYPAIPHSVTLNGKAIMRVAQ